MGLRFQKRIRLFKGLTLNLSKTGPSITFGVPGASVNVRGRQVTGNVGIPGTGLSYRQRLDKLAVPGKGQGTAFNVWKILAILLLMACVALAVLVFLLQ